MRFASRFEKIYSRNVFLFSKTASKWTILFGITNFWIKYVNMRRLIVGSVTFLIFFTLLRVKFDSFCQQYLHQNWKITWSILLLFLSSFRGRWRKTRKSQCCDWIMLSWDLTSPLRLIVSMLAIVITVKIFIKNIVTRDVWTSFKKKIYNFYNGRITKISSSGIAVGFCMKIKMFGYRFWRRFLLLFYFYFLFFHPLQANSSRCRIIVKMFHFFFPPYHLSLFFSFVSF